MKLSVERLVPVVGDLRRYKKNLFRADFLAGLSVCLVLVPQSMANAQLAGLPAHYGLYAATLPMILGSVFSSSRQMCTSLVAVIAMLTAAALEPLALTGTAGYIAYAVVLGLMVGLIQFGMGVFRLGVLVNFLSQPVISGFTNAAVILIALSQLGKVFGVTVENATYQYETVFRVLVAAATQTHWPSLWLALLSGGIIFITPFFTRRIPAILLAVAVTTFISWYIGFDRSAVVPFEAVKSERAQRLLTALSVDRASLVALGEERARLEAESLDARKKQRPGLALELNYQINVQNLAIQRLRDKISLTRDEMRAMRFVSQGTGNDLKMYDQGKEPQNALPSQTWRLKPSGAASGREALFTSGGEVVGKIPAGLPDLFFPEMNVDVFGRLFPFALVIAFIGLASSISIAKTMARISGERVDPNQELISQGVGNLSSALLQAGPVSGSFSSSAVNYSSGAKTRISSVFAGLFALLVLLFFTPLLYHLPQSVLAAVVICSMLHQVHLDLFRRDWQVRWQDGLIGIITFVLTLLAAPRLDLGVYVGVLLSVALIFYRSLHPDIISLTCGPGNRAVDVKSIGTRECRHIAVLRFQQALFFTSSAALENYILQRLSEQPELKHIHMVCTGMNSIDASGEESLLSLVRWLHKSGVGISFNGLNEQVEDVLLRSGVIAAVGRDNVFHTMHEAITEIHRRVSNESCGDCPWDSFCAMPEPIRDVRL